MHLRHAARLLYCAAFLLVLNSTLAVDTLKSASKNQYGSRDSYEADSPREARDDHHRDESYSNEHHYDDLMHNCPTPQSADDVRQGMQPQLTLRACQAHSHERCSV